MNVDRGVPPRSRWRTGAQRALAALAVAIAVNAGLIGLMQALNRGDSALGPAPRPASTVRLIAPPREPREPSAPPTVAAPTAAVAAPPAPAVSLRATDVPLAVRTALPVPVPALDSAPQQGSGGLMVVDRVEQPPRERQGVTVAYPREALRQGREGRVTVRLLIDRDGSVRQAELLSVQGPAAFGEAVTHAARAWRFEPARHGGRPVRVWALKTVRFRIGGTS